MRMRTVVRLGLLLALAAAGAAAVGSHGGRRDPARLVVAAPTLDLDGGHLRTLGVAECLFEADVAFGPPRPGLALAATDEGGGRWSLPLRPGVRFHDGRPLDAPAVVESLREALSRGDAAWLGALLTASARTRDVVEVVSSAPRLPVPSYLVRVPVLAPGAVDARGRVVAPVGTGPFVAARYVADEGARLVANRDWWGGVPASAGVDVLVARDPATRAMLVETGDADWAQRVSRADAARLVRRGFRAPAPAYLYNVYVVFRGGAGPVADAAVRRAVALAADRGRIARVAFDGAARPAGGVFPPGHRLHGGADEPVARDLAGAERVLEAAGWRRASPGGVRARDGVPLRVPLLTVADAYRPAWATAAELLREDLAEAGIALEVEVLERAAWSARTARGDFVATLRGRVPGWWPDPYGVLRTDFRSDGVNNVGRYASAAFDRALDAALAAPDDATREAALADAVRVLREDRPVVALVHDEGRETYVTASDVVGDDDDTTRVRAFPGPRARR